MENPLKQFLPVEDRPDGVYITVPRDKAGKIVYEKLINALETAKVTNYDIVTIKEVVEHARNAPERIGPLFEYYNTDIGQYVEVAITHNSASMTIDSASIAANVKPTPTLLNYCLKEKGVLFGLLYENIFDAVANNRYDEEIVVARGKEPVDGKDAQIDFDVDFGTDLRPQMQRDGRVDFRDVRSFTEVSEGQVIARKIPATRGEEGRKVTGEEVPATPGKNIDLPKGKNTELAEKGLALVATKTGILKPEGSLLSVSELMVVPKDVDYSVGNIKYSGELIIKGNVKPGFSLESEGDIEIEGQVESATVKSRNGTVTIQKGVLGKGNTFIYAKSKIYALFAQDATIETEGTITIDRHCLNCECTSKKFESVQTQSNIVGGTVKASNYIHATEIGNTKGADTKVVLFDTKKGDAKEKLKEYTELKRKVLENLAPIKKQVSTKASIFKQAGNLVTDRQKIELKKWVDSYNMINMKLEHIQEKIDTVTKMINSSSIYDGHIKVTGTIYPGAILEMYGRRKIIEHKLSSRTFQIDNNGEITEKGK